MNTPSWLSYWLPQNWRWFTTPSGSEPPSDVWIVKFIRKCQAPIIAHPLGALVLFIFFQWFIGYEARETFWWSLFFMAWWQWNVWEKLDSVSYPPREIIWRLVLGLAVLIPLIVVF